METKTVARAAVVALLLALTALATPSAVAHCSATNNGLLVQGTGTFAPCSDGGHCTNNGVIVSGADMACDTCQNNGVTVTLERSCFNEGGFQDANVCVDDECYLDVN